MSFVAGPIDLTLSLVTTSFGTVAGTTTCTAPTTPVVITYTTVNRRR